jgi:hypothetical protein
LTFVRFDLPEGQAVRKSAHAEALAVAGLYHNSKQLNMEVHAITPGYVGLSAFNWPRHIEGTIDEGCALVACGWWNNDAADCLVLRVQKGREFITDLELRHIFDLEDSGRKGVDDGYKRWGEWKSGEDLDWEFLYTTANYIDCFPEGYIIIPEGKMDIWRIAPTINGP